MTCVSDGDRLIVAKRQSRISRIAGLAGDRDCRGCDREPRGTRRTRSLVGAWLAWSSRAPGDKQQHDDRGPALHSGYDALSTTKVAFIELRSAQNAVSSVAERPLTAAFSAGQRNTSCSCGDHPRGGG